MVVILEGWVELFLWDGWDGGDAKLLQLWDGLVDSEVSVYIFSALRGGPVEEWYIDFGLWEVFPESL